MQYETIILELMTRVKKVEDELESLKEIVRNQNTQPVEEEEAIEHNEAGTTYQKMTDEMIERCYECGKKVHQGANAGALADELAAEMGMNRNSAFMYLYVVSNMLDGTIYKRAISTKAMKKYFDLILADYGEAGLQRALEATKLHIRYRKQLGHTVDSIETIYSQYEKME